MQIANRLTFVVALSLMMGLAIAPATRAAAPAPARNDRAMVVTVHPIATDIAAKVFEQGGNAVDAAVAAALALGVVDPANSGIGGGCFLLIRTKDGKLIALDGREMAPAAATRDMYIRDGKADTRLSQTGALASGVPGSLMVYDQALAKYGKKKLAELIEPAAKVAEEGFPISARFARRIEKEGHDLARFEASKQVFFKADGKPLAAGDALRQPELAASYRSIARDGIGWFYKGAFPAAVETWMKANGGIITAEDFARYHLVEREPLQTKYRGHTIVGFPPPSSGGIHVAQILGMLDSGPFDLRALEETDPAARVHVIAGAMKLAFADRAHWLGDPDFARVPRGLLDPNYLATLAKKIDPRHATPVEKAGDPPRAADDVFTNKHTTHIAAADSEGNFVALTTTLNTGFGSKAVIPGTGVLLNNQMDDFSVQPGVPNNYKLIGAEANAIAPGKRPLSSMSPTIVLDAGGRPVLTVGGAGGPTIINQVVLAITNHLALGDDIAAAMKRPRFHHQWRPDVILIERDFKPDVLDKLRAMGNELKVDDAIGSAQAIARPDAHGDFIGVPEPRGEGKAAGPADASEAPQGR